MCLTLQVSHFLIHYLILKMHIFQFIIHDKIIFKMWNNYNWFKLLYAVYTAQYLLSSMLLFHSKQMFYCNFNLNICGHIDTHTTFSAKLLKYALCVTEQTFTAFIQSQKHFRCRFKSNIQLSSLSCSCETWQRLNTFLYSTRVPTLFFL